MVPASPEDVWDAVTGDGWLADEVLLELRPGGDASFRTGDDGQDRLGRGGVARADAARVLVGEDGEPATRVELTIDREPRTRGCASSRPRPLELLDLVGIPLPGSAAATYGPALVAA